MQVTPSGKLAGEFRFLRTARRSHWQCPQGLCPTFSGTWCEGSLLLPGRWFSGLLRWCWHFSDCALLFHVPITGKEELCRSYLL